MQELFTRPAPNRWWTVVAGAVGAGIGVGVLVIYTFGAFAAEMATEFGWSRYVYSNALTVFLIASGVGSFMLGQLMDRFGVRLLCAALVAVFGISVASLALIPANVWVLYSIFAVIGLTGSAATAMPYAVAIRSLFDHERGLALGLVNFGAGIGSAIAPYCAGVLAGDFGWRGGFIGVGLAGLIPALGLLLLVREPERARRGQRDRSQQGWLGELRRPVFWLITIPIAAISIATFGVLGSMVPLLQDRQLSATSIAVLMSCVGVSSWLARPVVGYALDRVFAPFVAAASLVFAVAGLVLLVLTDELVGTVAAGILLGSALGSEGDLVTFLVSRYYPPAIYSRVLGAVWVTWAWGGGIGTFLAGASFREFGSYTPALVTFAVLLVVGIVVVCRLGPYPYPAPEKPRAGLSPATVKS